MDIIGSLIPFPKKGSVAIPWKDTLAASVTGQNEFQAPEIYSWSPMKAAVALSGDKAVIGSWILGRDAESVSHP